MANKRTYAAQAATVNTTALGGTTTINVELGHDTILQPPFDGLEGPAQIDRLVKTCKGSIVSQDVKNFLTLLTSTPTEMTFFCRESGAETYGKGTIDDPVILDGSLTISKGGTAVRHAEMNLSFEAKSATADDFDDIYGHLDAQTAPTYVDSERLADPIGCAHGAQTILHPTSLRVAVRPQVLREFGDGDLGVTAIDIVRRQITGTLGFQDRSEQTGPPTHELATKLMMAAMADLAVTVQAPRTGDTNQLITLKNCHFTRDNGSHRCEGGYSELTLDFALQWLDSNGTTKRTLGGADKIMTIANAG